MKTYGILCFVLALAMFAAPVAVLDLGDFSFAAAREVLFGEENETAETEETAAGDSETVAVLQAASGNVVEMDTVEYLVGCVACEMSAEAEPEALKAQAVAAYTNVQRLKADPDSTLAGADISDDPARHQGYLDEAARHEKWGDKYDAYNEKITEAVNAVRGQTLTCDGAYITAAYCALCPGRTESAANIWGGEVPYLQSVTSPGDRLSPDYTETTALSADEFREKTAADAEIVLGDDPSVWLADTQYSENETGVVTSVTVGGKTMTGQKLRTLLSLRSPAFTVEYADGQFTFTCTGNGHLVGMSQYGADYMARQGSTYEEILAHYYPGTTLSGA